MHARCAETAVVHLAGSYDEVLASESAPWHGVDVDRPFVLFVQPSLFDDARAPAGGHVGWAYCHVPNGATTDMTGAIEAQIERFAPGFRDRVSHGVAQVATAIPVASLSLGRRQVSGGET